MTYSAMQWIEYNQCGGSGLTVSAVYLSAAMAFGLIAVLWLVSWLVGRRR